MRRFVESIFGRPAVPVDDARPPAAVESEAEQTARALDEFRVFVRRSGRDLPTLVSSQLGQIDDLLHVVVQAAVAEDASTEQRYLLDAMVRDYLPTPVRGYLSLPEADRQQSTRATGILVDQLRLLEETIRDLLNQIRTHAIAELSTHGRFLASKFDEVSPELTLRRPADAGTV